LAAVPVLWAAQGEERVRTVVKVQVVGGPLDGLVTTIADPPPVIFLCQATGVAYVVPGTGRWMYMAEDDEGCIRRYVCVEHTHACCLVCGAVRARAACCDACHRPVGARGWA
jgi:hypothetical protein